MGRHLRRLLFVFACVIALSLVLAPMVMAADEVDETEEEIQTALGKYAGALNDSSLTDEERATVMTTAEEALREMVSLGFPADKAAEAVKEAVKAGNVATITFALQTCLSTAQSLASKVAGDSELSEKQRAKALKNGAKEVEKAVEEIVDMIEEGYDAAEVDRLYQEALAQGMNPKDAAKYAEKALEGKDLAEDDDDDDEEDDDEDDEDKDEDHDEEEHEEHDEHGDEGEEEGKDD